MESVSSSIIFENANLLLVLIPVAGYFIFKNFSKYRCYAVSFLLGFISPFFCGGMFSFSDYKMAILLFVFLLMFYVYKNLIKAAIYTLPVLLIIYSICYLHFLTFVVLFNDYNTMWSYFAFSLGCGVVYMLICLFWKIIKNKT